MPIYDSIFYGVFLPIFLVGVLIGFAIGYFTFRNTDVETVDKTINNQKYTITFEVKK